MNQFLKTTLFFFLCFSIPLVVMACIWDYDTIKMERSRFPSVLELITGKFLRHSPEFYEWRIKDRLEKLKVDPNNVLLLDDLAVAYDKTGQHELAIETANRTEKLKPGRYETASNLGTFYFHSGKLKEGLPYIEQALKINPNAHFGREKYQKILVEYVIQQRVNNANKIPLVDKDDSISDGRKTFFANSFDQVLEEKENAKTMGLSMEQISASIKGILGMMRFGSYDSPILLEALGFSLLSTKYSNKVDAKLLAARAFLKASYAVPEGQARIEYRELANIVLPEQRYSESIEILEPVFLKELEEANKWYAELREKELTWIREGKNPEIEFDKLYDAEPELSGMGMEEATKRLIIIGSCIVVLGICVMVLFMRSRKRAKLRS